MRFVFCMLFSIAPFLVFSQADTSAFISENFVPEATAEKKLKVSFTGYAGLEGYWYYKKPVVPDQYMYSSSFVTQPKLTFSWGNVLKNRVVVQPFFRADAIDKSRTHGDLSEAFYEVQKGGAGLTAGIQNINWSNMLGPSMLNAINQVDAQEDILKMRPMGQPLIKAGYGSETYSLNFYVIPFFRKKVFPDIKSRLSYVPLDVNKVPLYPDGKDKMSYAARLTKRVGDLDLGVSHYYGYRTMPVFAFDFQTFNLIPIYNRMNQSGVEIQYLFKSLIIKTELIRRYEHSIEYYGITTGLEYTFSNIGDTEFSAYLEYSYDEWRKKYSLPFSDNYFGMLKCTVGDVHSTEMSLKVLSDRKEFQPFVNFEFSRRIAERYTFTLNKTTFAGKGLSDGNPMRILQNNNNIAVSIKRFF